MRRLKKATDGRWGIGAAVARGACLAAAVIAVVALGREIGMGATAVRRGEITAADMLVELGEWLRGEE